MGESGYLTIRFDFGGCSFPVLVTATYYRQHKNTEFEACAFFDWEDGGRTCPAKKWDFGFCTGTLYYSPFLLRSHTICFAAPHVKSKMHIRSITDDGNGIFEVVIRCPHSSDATSISQELKRGQLQWKELPCDNGLDQLRLEMIKKMIPPPRCKFTLDLEEHDDGGSAASRSADSQYFEAYGGLDVHELMLRDRPRMEAFSAAIENAKEFIAGKAVLDVGTGTGVLAMMAAKAGARIVYAVEGSSTAQLARGLVEANNLSEIVQVLQSTVETVELPEQVDVIISEWMGFYLLHESMLGSVLSARDRWLKPGGLMLPGKATIHACPVSWEQGHKDNVQFWAQCYGLNLSLIGEQRLAGMAGRPLVEPIAPTDLISEPLVLKELDLRVVSAEELRVVEAALPFQCSKPNARLAGVALWFDCEFTAGPEPTQLEAGGANAPLGKRARDQGHDDAASEVRNKLTVVLSTAPAAPPTHWQQTTVLFGGFFDVELGEDLPMTVRMEQDSDNARTYTLTVQT